MFQFFESIEILIADVRNVTSTELSTRQLTNLVEEELRNQQKDCHMERESRPGVAIGKLGKCDILAICRAMLQLVAVFILLFFLGFVLFPDNTMSTLSSVTSSLSTKTKLQYSLKKINWYFFAMQLFRKGSTSLKLEKIFPMSDANIDGCVLNNPMYIEEPTDCTMCTDVNGFTSLLNDDGRSPLLMENQAIKFGLGRFQQILHRNPVLVNQHTIYMMDNSDYIRVVEDLEKNEVLEKLEQDKTVHVYGTTQSYMSAHILRSQFPRPQDFITRVALTFMSSFYIDGEQSDSFYLKTTTKESNFMYIQCLGSRRLIFTPIEPCYNTCQSFSRIMKKGDIVIYNNIWVVQSEPYGNSMSIAFVDNFELEQPKKEQDPSE